MMCQDVVVAKRHLRRSPIEQITTIGLDIAKHVFQVHGIDAAGKVLIRRKLRRGEVLEFFGKLKPQPPPSSSRSMVTVLPSAAVNSLARLFIGSHRRSLTLR